SFSYEKKYNHSLKSRQVGFVQSELDHLFAICSGPTLCLAMVQRHVIEVDCRSERCRTLKQCDGHGFTDGVVGGMYWNEVTIWSARYRLEIASVAAGQACRSLDVVQEMAASRLC
ncbi:MAG: hypothetical protein ABI563_18780, partial [Specibacter sp.]